MKYVQDTRTANGGDLNFLSYQEVINRVAQLILDKQESSRVRPVAKSIEARGETLMLFW